MTLVARFVLLALLGTPGLAFASGGLTPKIQLRLGAGQITNYGTAGGSAVTLSNLHIAGSLYVQPKIAFTVGYQVNLDLKSGSLPISGLTVSGRYYFMGQGTLRAQDWISMTSATRSGVSAYGTIEFAQRSYFFSKKDGEGNPADITGTAYALNGGVGMDFRLSPNVDLNAELNMTGFTFAASNASYRFGALLIYFGVGLLL